MFRTNEILYFFQNFKDHETEIILIQYGLVDSWKTFKYAPYQSDLESVIQQSPNSVVFLISTIPNLDPSRNSEIMKYNQVLLQLSKKYPHVYYIDVYNDFVNKSGYYCTNTDVNEQGCEIMTQKILSVYREVEQYKKSIG